MKLGSYSNGKTKEIGTISKGGLTSKARWIHLTYERTPGPLAVRANPIDCRIADYDTRAYWCLPQLEDARSPPSRDE